jgi:hypothetical protein
VQQPYNLDLMLFTCGKIESFGNAVSAIELICDQGLVLVEQRDGVDRASEADVASFLGERHFNFEATPALTPAQLASPAQPREIWGGRCARANALFGQATIGISRRMGNAWDLTMNVATGLHPPEREPLTTAIPQWLGHLDRVGQALYERVRPELGVLFASKPSDMGELSPHVLRRRLLAGWRTWYGPGYADALGRNLLLGLPDRAEQLGDGGIVHALDAAPLDLVAGKPEVYANVLAYLTERGIQPAWPRQPRPKAGAAPQRQKGEPSAMDEQSLDEFQEDVRELLSTAIVLDTGLRVLMLPLAWSELDKDHQTIAFRHLLYAVESQLDEHPGSRVRIEFEEIPEDLQEILAATYPAGGPVSYGLLTDPPAL